MAKIPDASAFGSSPTPQPASQVFGYNPAVQTQGMEAQGKALTGVGADLAQLQTHYATLNAAQKVNDAQKEAMNYLYDPQDGILNQKGQNAQGLTQRTQQWAQGFQSKYLDGINDPDARSAAQRELNGITNSTLETTMRHEVDQTNSFKDELSTSTMDNQKLAASMNYNNDAAFQDATQKTLTATNYQLGRKGINDPGMVQATQRSAVADLYAARYQAATQAGDAVTAQRILDESKKYISGDQQLTMDATQHQIATNQNTTNTMNALQNGTALPDRIGAPPSTVQAAVVDAANAKGIPAQDALTHAALESSMGQNLGARGTVGQTGPKGDIKFQSANMVDAMADARSAASAALGRAPEPWEAYLTYQQGAGGGPALLQNPNARAVDVLKALPAYKNNPDKAMDAILDNGGNLNQTAKQFTDFIQQKYNTIAARYAVDPGTQGHDIVAAQAGTGQAVQPGATPRQNLTNFMQTYQSQLDSINSIPFPKLREDNTKALNARREQLQTSVDAYDKSLLVGVYQTIAQNKLTDRSQIPPDTMAEVNATDPYAAISIDKLLRDNRTSTGSKEDQTNGPAFSQALDGVLSGQIDTPAKIMQLHATDQVTTAGFDHLMREYQNKNDLSNMKKVAFDSLRKQTVLTPWGGKDAQGEALWDKQIPILLKEADTNEQKYGAAVYDPNSIYYIGNSIKGMQRSPVQANIDTLTSDTPTRTADDIRREYRMTSDPVKLKALQQEAIDRGFYKPGPSAPAMPTVPNG